MADLLKTYSVVLNWQDGDMEQGTFGATVRAADHEAAELAARTEMRAAYAEQSCMSEEEEAELDPAEEFGGSVIEVSEGAIWKAAEMEVILRDLVTAWSKPGGRMVDAQAVVARAEAIIAEIDAL